MYTYPTTYKNKPLKDQWKTLQKAFSELKDKKQPTTNYSAGEGAFIIPHYRIFGSYNEAVLQVMAALKESRTTYDWRGGNWGPEYLRQLPIKESFWNTQGDIIILGAQFGQKHAGKSVQQAREALQPHELPLGLYECLIILLTHPERLQSYDDLGIDCPGDEYSYNADGAFSGAPFLCFSGGGVDFDAGGLSAVRGDFGSASAFLPQALENRTLNPLAATLDTLDENSAISFLKEKGYKITKLIEQEF